MSSPDQFAALEARVAALEAAQGDELQPGVFSINAAGELVETVGQLHANGVVLPLGHVLGASLFGPGSSTLNEVLWEAVNENGEDGANVVAYNFDPKPPNVGGSSRNIAMNVQAPAGEGGEHRTRSLEVIQSREADGSGEIFAQAGVKADGKPGAGASAVILNSLGQSDFAQFVGNVVSNQLQIQIGSLTHAFALGFDFTEIALKQAWAHEHLFFIATLHPLLENGTWITNCGPYNGKAEEALGVGFLEINNPKAQNVQVFWLSVGR